MRIYPRVCPAIKNYAIVGGSRAPRESCLRDFEINWTDEIFAFEIRLVIWETCKWANGTRPSPKRTTAQDFSSPPLSSFSSGSHGILVQAWEQSVSPWKREECRSGQTLESERAPTSAVQKRLRAWETLHTNNTMHLLQPPCNKKTPVIRNFFFKLRHLSKSKWIVRRKITTVNFSHGLPSCFINWYSMLST